MLQDKTAIAKLLLEIGAVTLQPTKPFTWASGIKSPIYTDNRLIMSYPAVRKQVTKALAAHILKHFPTVQVIAGTATAGIPHAAWVAATLDLPMIYVRSQAKDHGKKEQIEGCLAADTRVVVLDDLVSTGASVLKAVRAVQQKQAEVLGVVSIFTYELAVSLSQFNAAQIPFHALTDYTSLIDTATQLGDIDQTQKQQLQQWCADPEHWQFD